VAADEAERGADSSAPLRDDVRLLGAILGRVLVEQQGAWLLELVESIRSATRAARRAGPADVGATLGAVEPEAQALVLRAFAVYFQLANLAEQHHRPDGGIGPPRKPVRAQQSLVVVGNCFIGKGARARGLHRVLNVQSLELIQGQKPGNFE